MVNRNQNVDDIVRQVRHDDVATDNNLAAIVETIMVRNGVNYGLEGQIVRHLCQSISYRQKHLLEPKSQNSPSLLGIPLSPLLSTWRDV